MGRAKARLPWFGRSMVEHVVAQLASAVDEIIVVGSAFLDLPEMPVRIVRDRDPERGPLAGLREGLEAIRSEFAFVTSTDAPYLTGSFVSAMLDRETPCAPVAEGRVQVLCAVYPAAAWKEAERLLDAGIGRPLRLLEALDFEAVDFEGPVPSPPWFGFNHPQAYLECVRALDSGASAELEFGDCAALALKGQRHRVPVGTLGEILARWPETQRLVADGYLSPAFMASLGEHDRARDLSVPVGPGECVKIIDERSSRNSKPRGVPGRVGESDR
ncbi:MAG: hypothetical protein CL933_18875 [Deltaproteobacteria bacterium]|nr:hypothetical protein [Deltaproteobacteria bacterium]